MQRLSYSVLLLFGFLRSTSFAQEVVAPTWDELRMNVLNRHLEESQDLCGRVPKDNDDCPIIDGKRHCEYCDFTKCWKRQGANLSDPVTCNKDKPEASDCPDLLNPYPVECPPDLQLDWTIPEEQMSQGQQFEIKTTLRQGELKPVYAECQGVGDADQTVGKYPHANVHGCVKSATTWWCSELVPAYQPKSVVSSPAQCFNETENNVFTMQVVTSTLQPPNQWTLYAHYYFYTDEHGSVVNNTVAQDSSSLTKWHITRGATFLISGKHLSLSPELEIAVFSIGGLVGLVSVITLILTIFWSKHWVIIASSTVMCYFIIIGGLIGAASVFAFNPLLLSDTMCLVRLWSLPLAFDFIVIPMCLKTWRVYKLFGTSRNRFRITNGVLVIAFFLAILVEGALNTTWMFLAPLRVQKVYSTLDQNAYYYECGSDLGDYQNYFTIGSILLHLVPCLVLTSFAYRVRLSFKYARINRKLHEFDESLYIMLSLLNLTVVGLFVIVFQTVIESSPQSVTMMRTGGITWIVVFTLGLFFVPKFMRIVKWNPADGIPEAGSLLTGSAIKSSTSGGLSHTSREKRKKNGKGRRKLVLLEEVEDEGDVPELTDRTLQSYSEEEPESSYLSRSETDYMTPSFHVREDSGLEDGHFAFTSTRISSSPVEGDGKAGSSERKPLVEKNSSEKPVKPRPPSFLAHLFKWSSRDNVQSENFQSTGGDNFTALSVQDTDFSEQGRTTGADASISET